MKYSEKQQQKQETQANKQANKQQKNGIKKHKIIKHNNNNNNNKYTYDHKHIILSSIFYTENTTWLLSDDIYKKGLHYLPPWHNN